MKREDILEAIRKAKEKSKHRNFVQSLDFTMNFKGIDFKKEENKIDAEVNLPHSTKNEAAKVLVFVQDKNFAAQLKGKAAKVVMVDEIPSLKKKELDEILLNYSIILAEGPAMLVVGRYLGQQLAPKGRMPKPIQPTLSSYEDSASQYGSTIRFSNKKGKNMPVIHIKLGDENTKESDIADNIEAIYNTVIPKLPQKQYSIKSMFVKLTMGAPIKIGGKAEEGESPEKKQKPAEKKAEAAENGDAK